MGGGASRLVIHSFMATAGYAAGETYFPDGLNPRFYIPTDRGLEQKISAKLQFLAELDQQAKKAKRSNRS